MNTATQIDHMGVENLIASGDRLYCRQRERLAEEEAAHQRERFELQLAYEKRMRELMAGHDDAMRELERRWSKTRADGERMLHALQAMREG